MPSSWLRPSKKRAQKNSMKRLSVAQWAALLDRFTATLQREQVGTGVKQFVTELRRRRALRLLPRIMRSFAARRDAAEGLLHVHTAGARELPSTVEQELKLLAPHVEIQHTIDPHLIGGVRIAYNDIVIDGTVAARLTKLYEA